MYPILKNLISVIRRFQLAAILNVLGLSVAFAAFMIIMIQINFDYNYDKFHNNYDKIFRLECIDGDDVTANSSRPLAELFIGSSPHIVVGAQIDAIKRKDIFYVEKDGVRNIFEEISTRITPEFIDIFKFDFVEGTKEALKNPDNVIIPLSLSKKLFGDAQSINKIMVDNNGNQSVVGGVYVDFPSNSIINNSIYHLLPGNENKDIWNIMNYTVFILVNEASNAPLILENFNKSFDLQKFYSDSLYWEETVSLRLTALNEIHFINDVRMDEVPKANKQTLLILFSIAIVIIVIAGINFTNFTTALSPMRIKNINTQKVFGASQPLLRLSILFEAIFFCLLSYFIAIVIVTKLQDTSFSKMVDANLSFSANISIIFKMVFAVLFVGLLAGLYPAFYMTSFPTAFVLKGSFALSPKGKNLRNSLLCVQFMTSFALIISASFMYLQNYYMQNSPLGYNKDRLLTVNIEKINKNIDVITEKLMTCTDIEDVTYGAWLLSSADRNMYWGQEYKSKSIEYHVIPVHHTFLEMMGIEISEGRNFRQDDENSPHNKWIFNETAKKQYDMEINTTIGNINKDEIIGFVSDIKFSTFRLAVEPMAFYANKYHSDAYIRLKSGANLHDAISNIRKSLSEFDDNYVFDIRFYDEVLHKAYEKEISLNNLIFLFSFIAIFISIVGVFGLVVFDSQCRRKEIGIRKVHGAKSNEIIFMFNKVYFLILIICFVVAAPLAWFAIERWLQNFAYKTPMFWWVYLIAFISVTFITISTVTFQNWRAANENPVRAINSNNVEFLTFVDNRIPHTINGLLFRQLQAFHNLSW